MAEDIYDQYGNADDDDLPPSRNTRIEVRENSNIIHLEIDGKPVQLISMDAYRGLEKQITTMNARLQRLEAMILRTRQGLRANNKVVKAMRNSSTAQDDYE